MKNKKSYLGLTWFTSVVLLMCSLSLSADSRNTTPALAKVSEVTVAVNDLQKATQEYAKLLGVAQWQYFDLTLSDSENQVSTRPELRVARAQWQDIVIELAQPLADSSPVRQFLAARGEGLFSVGVASPELSDQLSARALPLFNARTAEGEYATWWDTFDALGIHIKAITSNTRHKPWGESRLPAGDQLAHRVFQLGIVVDDVKETAERYQQLLGLAPWMVVDFQAPHISNAQYLGAVSEDSGDTVIQVAYGNWAGLQIELLAPKSGPSPHRDFLITKGAGAHHLSFGAVKNHDELVQYYVDSGVSVQMQSDNGGEGRTATYMGSEEHLGFVLELTRVAQGPGSLRPSAVIGLPQKQGSPKNVAVQ